MAFHIAVYIQESMKYISFRALNSKRKFPNAIQTTFIWTGIYSNAKETHRR